MSEYEGPAASGRGYAEQVGSVAEEATKLVEAAAGWARARLGPAAGAAAGAAAAAAAAAAGAASSAAGAATSAAGAAASTGPRIATGAPECELCPICQLISAARGVRPESLLPLLDTAGSLLGGLRTALEAAGTTSSGEAAPAPPPGRIEHILLDQEPDA